MAEHMLMFVCKYTTEKKLTWCSHDKHCGVYYNASTHEIVKQRPFALKAKLKELHEKEKCTTDGRVRSAYN